MAAARRASTLERGRGTPPRLLSPRCEAPRKVLFEEFAYRVSGFGVCNPGLGRGAQPSNGTLGAKAPGALLDGFSGIAWHACVLSPSGYACV